MPHDGADYILLVDQETNKMLLRMDEECLTQIDLDLIDFNLLNKLISDMNLNLDFNYDVNGILKK